MAIALVGSVGTLANGTTTVQPGFGQATTAGNLLVGWAFQIAGTGSINVNQGWSMSPSAALGFALAYKQNSGAGETAPTFSTSSGTPTSFSAQVAEFSGAATSGALDQNRSAAGAATPQVTTALAADADAGELVIAMTGVVLSKAGTDTTTLALNNGTITSTANNDATSLINHFRFGYCVTTSNAAADAATATDTSMNMTSLLAALVSFKLASTAYQPRNSAINHQNPGVLMEAWHHKARSWRKKIGGIVVPDLWTPEPTGGTA